MLIENVGYKLIFACNQVNDLLNVLECFFFKSL